MTTKYKARTTWTKDSAGGRTLDDDKLIGLSVHYPGSGDEFLNGLTDEQVISRLRGWRKYHMEVRKWSDIGYQVAIDGRGQVWDLRGITRIPAASATTANSDANEEWGACLFIVGNNETPTPAAIEAFNDFRENKWLKKWPQATRVSGHGDVPGASTECPGLWLRTAIRSGELIDPTHEPDEGELEMADLTGAVVGRDKDGTATHMGELSARINHIASEFIDSDGLDSLGKRLTEMIDARFDALDKKVDALAAKVGK